MEELVKAQQQLPTAGMGVGIDFSSKLFQLKPTTLTINQGMTQAEGAIPGKLRVVETGEQFDDLTVTLLVTPEEARSWYIGEKGQLKRTPENLMCFSRDMVRPDPRSKMPQAITCATCDKHSWTNIEGQPGIPPECDPYYFAVFIDAVTQTPMKMYIYGTNKKPFEAGMQQLARTIKLLQAKGENPSIFDISFKISTEKYRNKAGQVNHILKVDGKSFHKVTPEEAEAFGQLYTSYINRGTNAQDEETVVDKVNETIDEQVVDGEIII